jgi:hypothetical protein
MTTQKEAKWAFGMTATGINTIQHLVAPAFFAHWVTGRDRSLLKAPVYHNKGSGSGDDIINVGSIEWKDQKPDDAAIVAVMNEASFAIDNWISERL